MKRRNAPPRMPVVRNDSLSGVFMGFGMGIPVLRISIRLVSSRRRRLGEYAAPTGLNSKEIPGRTRRGRTGKGILASAGEATCLPNKVRRGRRLG